MKGVTKSGFEFEVDERAIKDRKFLATVSKLMKAEDETEVLELSEKMVETMLGGAQVEKLDEHVRSMNDGYCPIDAFMSEVNEINELVGGLKNS